ncbi:MAG: phosphate regulon sensor histidine kinase PhoR [Alcaligenaceae bacterium]|nr:phosphate regulon sensor histidine kinase PhoR [Alcaligenaceae bacterium]
MRFKSRLILFVLVTAFFVLLQVQFGISWAIYLYAFCIFIYLLLDRKKFNEAIKWALTPTEPPPPNVGLYEDIIHPIYRHLRQQTRYIENLEYTSNTILSAAQALPSAAITLTPEFHIEWANKLATKILGIDITRDVGFNIFNIVRFPEFYEYAKNGQWNEALILESHQDSKNLILRFELTRHSSRGFLLLCQDITHLEKLRTAQQDFVANVSHELRTPLTVLIGFLETINELPPQALSEDQLEHYGTLMREQAHRMQAIVSDLLTLSTLESSQLSGGDTIKLSSLIKVAARQAETLSNNQHKFDYDIDPELSVFGNQTELLSAITNLITNAVRYTPAGGTINVRWSQKANGEAVFSVRDTGLGIAMQDIPRLTERFYRVDKSRSRASGGTGLGLAITKHIVIRHNAQLKIDSALHKGSTFSIIFPKDVLI